jgi:hypothetical protein
MDYQGLLELMQELCEGGELKDFELEWVKPLPSLPSGRFEAMLSVGALCYRLTSYMPPTQIKRDMRRILDTLGQ